MRSGRETRSDGEVARRERSAVITVGAQFFLNGAVVASFLPRLPEIRDRLEVSIDTLGIILAVAAVSGIVGSAASSRAIGRLGTRAVIVWGGVVLCVCLSVIATARSVPALLIALIVLGGTDAVVDVAMNLQGSWLSARRSMPIMNRLHGMWSVGMLSGGATAALSAALGVSSETHLLVASGSLLVLVILIRRGLVDDADLNPAVHQVDPLTNNLASDSPPGRSQWVRPLILFGFVGAAAGAVEWTSSDWAAFRLADDFGASAGSSALGFVAFTAGMTIGRLFGDWIQARVGADVLLQRTAVLVAIGVFGAAFAPNLASSIASFALVGLAIAPVFPRLYDDAAGYVGRRGSGLGALTSGMRIAALVTPAIVGTLAATSLSVGAAMAFITLPGAIALIAATRMTSFVGSKRRARSGGIAQS